MKIMTGIDLHSNNAVCALIDEDGKRLGHRKVPCELQAVLEFLKPYRKQIDTIAVESTFNWYWLVDGLQDAGYRVLLANPAKIEQYQGLKHSDDKSDAFFLAEMLRLKILPTGYLYERSQRSVRDLLRRRMGLVRQRTHLILSLKSLHQRMTGQALATSATKTLGINELVGKFQDPHDQLIAREQGELIRRLSAAIRRVEKAVEEGMVCHKPFERLKTIPGVGPILGLTIALESGDMSRFPTAGDFASYSRCVNSNRLSNGKSKGRNNARAGNRYIAWAWVEAANFARRFDPACRRFFDRKMAQTNRMVATKALACKLSKAAWHMVTCETDYDPARIFPGAKKTKD